VLLYVERSRSSVKDALARTKPIMSDYLLEEVFSNLSDDQQEFLVTTSIASAFSPSLAEHITGFPRTKVMEIVDFLKESDLFIEYVEDSDKEEWFRYQALFSETLSTRKAHMDSEKALAVKRAARDWFEEHSYLDHVVAISSDIRDYAKIKEVILAHWLFHSMTDSHATLIRWASLIPEAEIRKNPMVCAILAMPVAVAGDLEKGNAYISNAVENLREEDDFLSALCMSQKAYISTFQNDLADARACAEQALEHLPAKEYYLRGMMLQVIASSYLESEPLRAKAGFIKAIELQQPLGNKNLLCSAYSNLAAICQHLGHIKEAEHYVEMALGVYPQQESCFKPMLSFAFLAMMGCCYQRANYRKAQEAYDMFEACCQALGVLSKIAEAKALSAKVSYSLGSPAGKGEFFQALSVSETGALLSFPSLPMSKDYLAAFRAKALERAGRGSPEAFVRVFEYGLQLHLDADGICEQACAFADSIDKEERIACVYAHIIAALCCEKAMRHTASLDYMAKALLLAHEHMLIQTMLENGSYIKPLLKRLCVHEKWGGTDAARFAQEVLRQLDTKDFKLTDREIAVIRSVAEGRTVEETARELYISRNTAKKHLANIYSKLGVSSKMQAVILLKQEGII
ncbi:MAG: LuxR C-terminal-related transcriptional regulator, partial [Coriobacteriaceae bacterium]|jgi:ATP/maltotriose-dependent transcriptional regulator MalT|nr:LuxR C-terminal-related transcriptional regulator [Coriobacteriaceae bacterium]